MDNVINHVYKILDNQAGFNLEVVKFNKAVDKALNTQSKSIRKTNSRITVQNILIGCLAGLVWDQYKQIYILKHDIKELKMQSKGD
jgi:hypothetical protein